MRKMKTPASIFCHFDAEASTAPANAGLSAFNLRPIEQCFSESAHLKEERPQARGSPQNPSKTGRIAQLCALAADPNEDTAECALADLFRETPPMGASRGAAGGRES